MIWIVEDDDIARGAMRSLLAACGYDNVAVPSGEEAMKLLESGAAPDAAVVDWDLPGMSGVEFIRQLGAVSPNTSMVLVTGAARERVDAVSRELELTCLRKPLDFQHLLRMLPKRSIKLPFVRAN